MIRVANAKEAPATLRSLKEHAIAARIGRAVSDTMENNVNVDTRTQRFMEPFAAGAGNNLLDRKIRRLGMFAMEKRGGYPNFLRDFHLCKGLILLKSSILFLNITTHTFFNFH